MPPRMAGFAFFEAGGLAKLAFGFVATLSAFADKSAAARASDERMESFAK